MLKIKKIALGILILLNIVVLSGQIWPENAPPFASIVNIIFLISSLLFFIVIFTVEKFKN
jgi:hypothetical protein